jgi:hypothetical protein
VQEQGQRMAAFFGSLLKNYVEEENKNYCKVKKYLLIGCWKGKSRNTSTPLSTSGGVLWPHSLQVSVANHPHFHPVL